MYHIDNCGQARENLRLSLVFLCNRRSLVFSCAATRVAVVMWAFLNLFRIAGDLCHLLSFVVMFWKLHTSRSVAGQGWMQHSTPSCCAPGQS
jgi:hypothetical protein